MYLKELHMVGFKSFAQSVRVELGPGITAVVGPNGSGKSNIVDAVRWVLGEQSPRALRGAKSEDVIFAGSAMRRPVGMAEVTLVLDNSESRVAVDTAEIAIARRLYRSGDTEYLLNRRRARLRDVLDVAGQAGLGPDSYCVVGQGAIEQLVLQRPQERRSLIADAADIRRYETRLAEIESDLSQTQANALRASAVAAEIRPQLDRLRGQADRAERHRRVRDDVERVVAAWYSRALPGARGAIARAQGRRAELQTEIADVRNGLADIALNQTALRDQGTALRSQLQAVQGRLRDARDGRERLRVEHAGLDGRRQSLSARLVEIQRQTQPIQERIAAAMATLERSVAAQEEAVAEAARWGSAVLAPDHPGADAALGDTRRAQAEAQRRLDLARSVLERLDREQAEAQSALDAAATATAVSQARRAESEARTADLVAALAEAEHELVRSRASAEAAEPRLAQVRNAVERSAEHLRSAAAEVEAANRAIERLLGEDRALSAIFPPEQAERWTWRLMARLPAPSRYARAISAALGEAAAFRLVEGDTAWFAEMAADEDPHTSVLAPASPSESPDFSRFRSWVKGVLGDAHSFALAVDVLDADADRRLAERYLGDAIVVGSLDAARRAASALRAAQAQGQGFSFRVAIETGECLWASGERVRRPPGQLPLEVTARRAELAGDVAEARTRVGQAEAEREAARSADDRARKALAAAELERQRVLAETRQREGQIRSIGNELRREQERTARLAPSREDPQLPLFADLPQRREAALAGVEEAARLVQVRSEELARAEEERRAALERFAQTAADRALAAERLARRKEAADRDAQELARLRQEAETQADQRVKGEDELASLVEALEAVLGRLAAAEVRTNELEVEADQLAAMSAECEAARATVDAQQRDAQARLADLREAEATAGAEVERAQGLQARCEAEIAAVAEALGVEPASFAQDLEQKNLISVDLAVLTEDDLHQQLVRAQRELRSVGAVDYGVLADYSVLKDRYELLTTQIEDLVQTEASIREGMAEVREQMRARFEATFDDVNRRFADLFRHLFRGGDAELLLAGDPDSSQAGVDIVAQPPGKRLHRLATLSGGERALVGAALLLALIGANPSPFCMLDEVDAALDEANVQRFVETIRELALGTQFILVTHNRATMEAADALYGVTMTPGAVSQVVAIRLDDAVPTG